VNHLQHRTFFFSYPKVQHTVNWHSRSAADLKHFQVLKILHGDQSEDLSFLQRQEARLSFDVDDVGCSLSDKGGEVVDMQMHMALAMLGVDDDDVTSQCSTDPAHSDAFLEEYLEDRVDN
jgi:hypothetical protein